MPASVVHGARDEHKWQKAKELAADAGRSGDYAYIMGIYKKMEPSGMQKSEGFYIRTGQVVTPATMQNLRTARGNLGDITGLNGPQPIPGLGPRLSIASITRDIGMDASTQMVWRDYLSDLMGAAPDEYSMRSDLYGRTQEVNMDPYLAKAIIERATQFWRHQRARKSIDAKDTIRKSGAPVRECYEAIKSYLNVAGADGVPYDGLDPYEQCYGPGIMAEVMGVLDDTGAMTFDGDRFYSNDTPQFVASL